MLGGICHRPMISISLDWKVALDSFHQAVFWHCLKAILAKFPSPLISVNSQIWGPAYCDYSPEIFTWDVVRWSYPPSLPSFLIIWLQKLPFHENSGNNICSDGKCLTKYMDSVPMSKGPGQMQDFFRPSECCWDALCTVKEPIVFTGLWVVNERRSRMVGLVN